ncbi:hypothetical protein ACGFNX_04480 [Streptomyces sp. NPDC048723]|uniref:hypothetical protein n=1 Tax=Streptomyces sp. NPDC048723 TaxID=3365589 RepID=UPI0037237C87
MEYQLQGGTVIEALQLTLDAPLGDHEGYSGGPVEREPSPAILGIIIEQYPDRLEKNRSSSILFAAKISQVFTIFSRLDGPYQARVLHAQKSNGAEWKNLPTSPHLNSPSDVLLSIKMQELYRNTAHPWQMQGLMNPEEISRPKLRIVEWMLRRIRGGDRYG